MALTPAVVDIPLSPINQTTSDTMGPPGALKHLIDGQIKKYEPHYVGTGGVVPSKIKIDPRDAFVSLPSAVRDVTLGTATSAPWSPAELLNALDEQLVSIDDAIPRVFNGTSWSAYNSTRTLTNKLSGDVFHTSQHTIQAPDSAWLAGVTCSVWTETVVISTGPVTTTYIGFRADNGAWVVTPTVLLPTAAPNVVTMAKVVTDGVSFFVVFNDPANTRYFVRAYDINGALIAGAFVAASNSDVVKPGNWDIIASPTGAPNTGTVILAQARSATSDLGVNFVSIGLSGSSVTTHANNDATLHCAGPLAWITNDTGNGLAYIATLDDFGAVWAYEITALAQTHQYSSGFSIASDNNYLDSITGYVGLSVPHGVVLSIGLLPNNSTPASAGPPVDPAFRFLTSVSISRISGGAVIRTNQSVCQVSRAFAIDGEYYVYAYYQSGSGLGLLPVSIPVTITAGDYMIGAPTQPIAVVAGDSTQGSPIGATSNSSSFAGSNVYVSNAHVAVNILLGDFVNATTVSSAFAVYGIPAGTTVLIWSLSGRPAITGDQGSRITVAGSSVAGANDTWDVIAVDNAGRYITPLLNSTKSNSLIPIGNFTHAGTFTLVSLTAYVVNDLSPYINSQTERFFLLPAATVTVTGSSHGNNITGVHPARVFYEQAGPNYLSSGSGAWGGIWVLTGSQTNTIETFGAVLTPSSPNAWSFANGEFDATYVGTDLVVSADPAVPSNVGTYPVTSSPFASTVVTGGATAVIAQVFGFPFPTIAIQLTTQNAYTFKLQSITPNYTFQNAIVSVQGAFNPNNNGTYQIVQINADGTFIAYPTNSQTNQVNEGFTGAQTITIFLAPNIQPEFQPTWVLVPLQGLQPVAGRFEYGLAYADWRVEINATLPNIFPMSVSSPAATTGGRQICLPYRAQNITSATREVTAAGQVDIGVSAFDSTVGLKVFTLGKSPGQSYSNSGELLIPGPMATVFTPSGFREDNFNLALEAPFLVSQSVGSAGKLALTQGATYFYVAVGEATDENGNRIFSPPSPALQVTMSGTNNVATLGGRVTFPTSSTGGAVANTYGPTTRQATISLYRTAWINGVPTTQRYKITTDLNPNGLAPLSTLNPSGFSFPNSFTWQYIDQNDDANLNASEILYVDKGFLPRFPAPAFIGGIGSWKNREWAIGYDGAIWMSGEKAEGDAIWFNPAFRYVLPTDDKPRALAALEEYLLVFCENSIWYIPAAQFPDATGANGGLPTPVQLPFRNGSANGFVISIRDGVAYDSTAGGCWMITRSLENHWLGEPLSDTLTGTITGMAVDKDQRLFVQQAGSPVVCVYDRVPQAWYEWRCPTQGLLLSTYRGQACYQDTAVVAVVTPGGTADVVNGVTTGIAPDITIAPLNIGNVRGLKRVWEFQAVGEYLGPHRMNVVLSYPEDDQPDTLYNPFTPSPSEPYILPFNPIQEAASVYGIRLYVDFVGIGVPGLSATLEMISAQVGMEPIGLNKRPTFVTLKAR